MSLKRLHYEQKIYYNKNIMSSIHIAILGVAIGFAHNIFFENLSENWSMALNAIAILFIFIGIVGLFKNQI